MVVDVAGWQVGLMTCYDLRFPELARRLVDAGAEVLVVPAAWLPGDRKVDALAHPARRPGHREHLLRRRCRAARAALRRPLRGVGPLGDVLAEADGAEQVIDAVLDRADLDAARRTNPSLANRRL